MTSNLGSEYISQMGDLGFVQGENESHNSLKDKIDESLKESFRPEILNRLDEIIIFNYLDEKQIKEVVELELLRVGKQLAKKDIKIRIEDKVKDFLVKQGFDRNLGARPLKRVIQKHILDPLSLKMVIGEIGPGERVYLTLEKDQIVFGGLLKKQKGVKVK